MSSQKTVLIEKLVESSTALKVALSLDVLTTATNEKLKEAKTLVDAIILKEKTERLSVLREYESQLKEAYKTHPNQNLKLSMVAVESEINWLVNKVGTKV